MPGGGRPPWRSCGTPTQERDFVRDASHQLRTPITVARGHAELILEAHPHSPVAGDVRVIAGELQRLSTISDRLIMLAAAEQPGFLDARPVDIESLVESTVTRWRPVASRRWQRTVNEGGTVLVDRERIECALDALIENAVNATVDGDLIEIAAGTDGDATTIEVTDEGAGIPRRRPSAHLRTLLRGGPTERGATAGPGLAYRWSKAIAEAHGGSVTVSSEPGKGTTFRLRLNGRTPTQAPPRRIHRSSTSASGTTDPWSSMIGGRCRRASKWRRIRGRKGLSGSSGW